jgi:ketosteroid isomerase-like protein
MFIGGAAAFSAALPLSRLPAATRSEIRSAKQFIIDWYAAFANPKTSKDRYLSFTTPDYLLLENGVVLDREGDLALFLKEPSDFVRHDSFDFRRVWFAGDRAFLVYFLHSEMSDSKEGQRTLDYLESAILRRSASGWRAELLHSTRIARPKT